MRVNPKLLANMQALYGDGQNATALPEGTYVNLAATKYVKDNDANRDKCLSKDEVSLSQEAFDKLDADRNGKIDVKEMRTALKGQDAAIAAYYRNKKPGSVGDAASGLLTSARDETAARYVSLAATRFLRDNDANRDGGLALAETSLTKTVFDKLDADKNGKLELAEIKAGLKGRGEAIETYYKGGTAHKSVTDLTSSLLGTI